MVESKYPLKQVIEVKEKRVDDAEKVVQQKKQLLEKEQEKLKEREKERDEVSDHKKSKLAQIREEMDRGTTSRTIEQMRTYLKIVKEKLVVEEKKVKDQQDQVALAQTAVEQAKEELNRKRQEVDKLKTHRKDWEKEMRKEEEITEGREQDELGSISHLAHRRQKP